MGVSSTLLDSRLAELERNFSSRLAALASSASANTSAVYRVVGEMGNIGRLDDVTITNSTITGGSVAAASVSGTLTNALDSLSGVIASLTGTELSYTRATFESATTTNLVATNATTTNFAVTGSATSTFSGGITIEGGCLSVNGACLTGGASLSGGTSGLLAAWTSATEITATSSPTAGYFVATSSTASILPYASTTAITTGSLWGSAFTSCSGSNDKLLYNASTGTFSCGSDLTGGLGGTDVNWTFFNGTALRPSTTTNQVLIGGTSTTTLAKLEVQGGTKFDYASTTALTVSGTSYLGTATTTVLNANTAAIGSLSLGSLSLANTLAAEYGGTGVANPLAAGVLIGSYAGGTWQQLATSSLGLLTTHVAEGSNLYFTPDRVAAVLAGTTTDALAEGANKYYTDARVDQRLNATTSLGTLTAAPNLSVVATSLTGFLKATAGVLSTALIDLASDVTGLLSVGSGGTGWANLASGTVLLGNGSGALATTTRGNLTETGSSILTISGGTNALLGTGATIQVAQAGSGTSGYLSSADWTTFNSKQAALGFTPANSSLTLSTTYPLQGGGDLSGNRTLSLAFGTTTSNTWGGTQTFTNTISGSITGNAGTATGLQTPRTINGTSFDGTQNITITAASSTLLVNSNTWSGLNQFANATTSLLSAGTLWLTGITGSTQCLRVDSSGIVSGTGSDCGTGGGAFAWTPTTNFATAVNATSSILWFQSGLHASSTSRLANLALDASGYLNFGATTGSSGYGFRDNNGTLEFKNSGGSWSGVNMATSGPSFSVHKNGTNQTVTASTLTKLTWSTETFDTNNNFASNTFTPTVPGKYIITLNVNCSDATSLCATYIYKNGSAYFEADATVSSGKNSVITGVVDMNGTTDYIEAYVYMDGTTVYGSSAHTRFSGALIAPINANNVANWQYDGTQTTLLDATKSVGIGTSTPWGKLAISSPSQQSGTIPLFNIASTTNASLFTVLGSGNVGISTTSPSVNLDIAPATGIARARLWGTSADFSFRDATATWFVGVNTLSAGAGRFTIGSGAPMLTVDTAGNVGIGTTPGGSATLQVSSSNGYGAYIAASASGAVGVYGLATNNASAAHYGGLFQYTGSYGGAWGLYCAGGTGACGGDHVWTNTSDERLKTNIETLSDAQGLDAIRQLRPVTFDWKDAKQALQGTQYGFISQEMESVFPSFVTTSGTTTITLADGSAREVPNTKYLSYASFVVPLVKAVQELNLKLEDLATTTPEAQWNADTFLSRFFTSLKNRLTQWFADAMNGITKMVADTFSGKELCLADAPNDPNPLCVTKPQLAALLSQSAATALANPTPADTPPSADDHPANPLPDPTEAPTAADASADEGLTEPPIIEIQGNNPAHIQVGNSYNDLGARITGPTQADTNRGIKTFLNGALVSNIVLDTSLPATDTIDYVATNAAGTSTSTRTVIIELPTVEAPPTEPTLPPITAPSSASTIATSTPAQ